jgi:plasmid stabilization system protein ParE
MILPVVLRPEAEGDLHDAHSWYERQQPGLGNRFIAQVSAAFERLGERPGMYSLVWEDVHSCRLHTFPYLV